MTTTTGRPAVASAAVAWFASDGVISAATLAFWAGLAALPLIALVRVVQSALMGLGHVVVGQSADLFIRPVVFLVLIAGTFVVLGGNLDAPLAVILNAASIGFAFVAGLIMLRRRMPAAMRVASAEFQTRSWTVSALSLGFLSGAAIVNTAVAARYISDRCTSWMSASRLWPKPGKLPLHAGNTSAE